MKNVCRSICFGVVVWTIFAKAGDIITHEKQKREWVKGVSNNPHQRGESYLGDPCSSPEDCLVEHSDCEQNDNRWWNKQKFCICAQGYHPSTGYCDEDRKNTTTTPQPTFPPIEELPIIVPKPKPKPAPIIFIPASNDINTSDRSAQLSSPLSSTTRITISNRTQNLITQVVQQLVPERLKPQTTPQTTPQPVETTTISPSNQSSCFCNCTNKALNSALCGTTQSYRTEINITSQAPTLEPEQEAESTSISEMRVQDLLQMGGLSEEELQKMIREAAADVFRNYFRKMLQTSPPDVPPLRRQPVATVPKIIIPKLTSDTASQSTATGNNINQSRRRPIKTSQSPSSTDRPAPVVINPYASVPRN